MKAAKTKPAEKALGCAGFLLSIPTLAPIAAIMVPLQRHPNSKIAKAIGLALLFPLFLIAAIVFIPYMIALWLLGAVGLVRREMPPSLMFIRSLNRIDITAAPDIAERLLSEIREAGGGDVEVNRWEDEQGLHLEISPASDVREWIERIERDDPIVEVGYVD